MNGRIATLLFEHFFQAYQDDGRMMIEGCVKWTSFLVEKMMASNPGPLDQ